MKTTEEAETAASWGELWGRCLALRRRIGVGQSLMATLMGVSYATYWSIESGRKRSLSRKQEDALVDLECSGYERLDTDRLVACRRRLEKVTPDDLRGRCCSIRRRLRYTQEQMATELQMGSRLYGHIEQGRKTWLRRYQAEALEELER